MRTPNFVAGPSAMPLPVLEQIRHDMLDYLGTGKSILETSHRSPEFEAVLDEANHLLRTLLDVPGDYDILWLQGGASVQFAMVPLNLLTSGDTGAYVNTGVWSTKAQEEAARIASTTTAASSEGSGFDRIPERASWNVPEGARYVHITSNNTIYGTQYPSLALDSPAPLVCDMSSDFLARPVPIDQFSLIYAGAQKNLGPAGVTVVIGKRELLKCRRPETPTMLRYETHAKANSLYNTPPVFAIYASMLVLRWLRAQGGLDAIARTNEAKAAAIYGAIDEFPEVFRGRATVESRSRMNVTFRVTSPERERAFLEEAERRGLMGLRGHRSAGGVRASLYNAVTWDDAEELAAFMAEFATR